MNVGWLKDFLSVAETGNFTRAAENRNISQAAFSRRILSLETWLGVTLIDRSVFPTRLTPEGDRFRDRAVEIVNQITDARVELTGQTSPPRDQVRIALPHTLATGRLGKWTDEWAPAGPVRLAVSTGNVHDMVTSLVGGGVDILICFQNAQQPFHLSADQYDRLVIGSERLRPYGSVDLVERLTSKWPGTVRSPIPLLMYSPGAYLARMVDLIIENANASLSGVRMVESDMADVLRTMALAGHGIAWLPDCCARATPLGALRPVGDDTWSLKLSIVAYSGRTGKRAPARRLWSYLVQNYAGRETE